MVIFAIISSITTWWFFNHLNEFAVTASLIRECCVGGKWDKYQLHPAASSKVLMKFGSTKKGVKGRGEPCRCQTNVNRGHSSFCVPFAFRAPSSESAIRAFGFESDGEKDLRAWHLHQRNTIRPLTGEEGKTAEKERLGRGKDSHVNVRRCSIIIRPSLMSSFSRTTLSQLLRLSLLPLMDCFLSPRDKKNEWFLRSVSMRS